MNTTICIISFYKFIKIKQLQTLQIEIQTIADINKLTGTILIAPEGINGTIEGKTKNINSFLYEIKKDKKFKNIEPKYSYAKKNEFIE